ncbi:TRAM domain-containing protein [Halobacteria archaeon AArc-m2/3/4]|uniref:TRAM domain-containing protein n=1 Tax=Natronoglomus mannanivorans TaxID=2979990 RepID=A0AAP2YYM8_9EURY|nr:TRAM domain-containing protein [Halobacteria archaeon AArc-xg1-1]MCU4975117.1 TRAM domain-containing protein [Halobacteria archaeon AArc-m2/3/4]
MEISDKLLCLFSTDISVEDDRYVIEVPRQEVETGDIDPEEIYRVALISRDREQGAVSTTGSTQAATSSGSGSNSSASTGTSSPTPPSEPQPPVEVGETRYVEIEDIGKQGDGIARVERGYVIIVPGAEVGERVKIEVTEVKSNFAVGEIIEETF